MLFYCCLISHFLLLFVFLHVCVCLSSCLLYFACTCACVYLTYPVNGLCYHTLNSPKCSPEKTLLTSTSPRKAFSYRACRQCVSMCHACPLLLHFWAPAGALITWLRTWSLVKTKPHVLVSFRQLHKATAPSHWKTQIRKSARATRDPVGWLESL